MSDTLTAMAESVNAATAKDARPGPTRTPSDSIAFLQLLQTGSNSTFRVDLIAGDEKGVGIRAMIPLPMGAVVVLSIAHHPPLEGLFLSRVTHCTRLANGRYHIGMTLLDRREGNLNPTRIPDAWRKG